MALPIGDLLYAVARTKPLWVLAVTGNDQERR
jgi:hypothetical protein